MNKLIGCLIALSLVLTSCTKQPQTVVQVVDRTPVASGSMPAVVEQKTDNFNIYYPTMWVKLTDKPMIKGYRVPRPTFGYGVYEISPAKLLTISVIAASIIKGLWSWWHKNTVNVVGNVGVDPTATVKVNTEGTSLPVGTIPPLTGRVDMTPPHQDDMPFIRVKPPEQSEIPTMKVVVKKGQTIAVDTSAAQPLTVNSDSATPLTLQPGQEVLLHTDTEHPLEFPPLEAPSSMPTSELKVEGFTEVTNQLVKTTQVLAETQQKIAESNEFIGQMIKGYNDITNKFIETLESLVPKKSD